MADGLFPDFPEDITSVSDEDLAELSQAHEEAAKLVAANDREFLGDLDANEIIAQYEAGAANFKAIKAETAARAKAFEDFQGKVSEISATFSESDEPAPDPDPAPEGDGDEEAVVAEAEEILAEAAEEEVVEEKELVTASAEAMPAPPRFSRTAPPTPDPSRVPAQPRATSGTALVAAGELARGRDEELSPHMLAERVKEAANFYGPMAKTSPEGMYRFGGPEHKIARADFGFPEERVLEGRDEQTDWDKVLDLTPAYLGGKMEEQALLASGGLCAPLEPIYTMPNFASEAEPVWDSLNIFRARRGGVNVPAATYIGDITTAISSISEADDAAGGTFATKSCQDLTCPDYAETAVQILAHCREYGNLNARAWPEKIAHENALTMAALARTSERFILGRIKSFGVKTNSTLTGLSALTAVTDVIEREIASIRYLLRMDSGARFRFVAPVWLRDLLLLDTANTQFDRYRSKDQITEYLRVAGVDPVWHLDNVAGAVPFSSETTGTALECFPTSVQFAIYPEGALLGVDSGVLELGIVRDSTLNSTNDFQVFGERFRNVAKLGPDQAIRWHTLTLSPNGVFPALGTAYTCTGGI